MLSSTGVECTSLLKCRRVVYLSLDGTQKDLWTINTILKHFIQHKTNTQKYGSLWIAYKTSVSLTRNPHCPSTVVLTSLNIILQTCWLSSFPSLAYYYEYYWYFLLFINIFVCTKYIGWRVQQYCIQNMFCTSRSSRSNGPTLWMEE